ncbi:hypothetical protein BV898_01756 [Hypsibius exemplaris]|uniref:Uncharacterized protein n=1 Tax=Hypsibius exemplaris TaxID=2072580 RepID=A0A1W0XBC2_HYPEX|nr:hypothetical protein BV898_01756 [Hypsibius exemplaris]
MIFWRDDPFFSCQTIQRSFESFRWSWDSSETNLLLLSPAASPAQRACFLAAIFLLGSSVFSFLASGVAAIGLQSV